MESFDLSKNYVLEDARVRLSPLQMSDYEHLLPFANQEPELWTFSLVKAAGAEGLRDYLSIALRARQEGKEYPFIVFDKSSGQWAGSTRFYDIQLNQHSLQLGYTWYGRAFQRTGLNRHCKFLLLQFAFDTIGMERVEFRADHENARSIAAMQAIGCTVEGVLRSHAWKPDGTRRSSIVLSILKHEWDERVRERLFAML